MLEPCADGVRLAHPLFQEGGEGCRPISALQLRLVEVPLDVARQLNRLWHRTLPKTVTANLQRSKRKINYAADHDGIYYAVAIWTDPVAPQIGNVDTIELRRFAIAPDAPEHTASRMLGIMTRLLRKKFPDVCRLISYQAVDLHVGTIYKAAGWIAAQKTKYSGWDRPSRARKSTQQQSDTVRWEKVL
jgi:hypothetical protein